MWVALDKYKAAIKDSQPRIPTPIQAITFDENGKAKEMEEEIYLRPFFTTKTKLYHTDGTFEQGSEADLRFYDFSKQPTQS
jgi:hypothetical protein